MTNLQTFPCLDILYRASQKDVPNFNNSLLEFYATQIKRISIDGKENSLHLFQAHYKYSIYAPPVNDTHQISNQVLAKLFVACRGQSL
jgi:hypothetical protein